MFIKSKTYFLLFYMLTISLFSKSQSIDSFDYSKKPLYTGDTLQFLQTNIIQNKELYLHKSLKYLLNNLPFQVKSFLAGHSSKNVSISEYISISFCPAKEAYQKRLDDEEVVNLVITWEAPFSWPKVIELIRKDKGDWTKDVQSYFEDGIIKEIILPKYLFERRKRK